MKSIIVARFAAFGLLVAPLAASAQTVPSTTMPAPPAPPAQMRQLPPGGYGEAGRWAPGRVERMVQLRFYGGLRTLGLTPAQREQVRAIQLAPGGDAHDKRVAILNVLSSDQRDRLEREMRRPGFRGPGRRPLT